MIISFSEVSKSYKIRLQNGLKGIIKPDYMEIPAVNELSFAVRKPEIIGLIGKNGAGKSTVIKLLTGILSPSNGKIRVFGMNPFEERKELMKKVGVVFGQRSILHPLLPVKYTLEWLASVYKLEKEEYLVKIKELGKTFGVTELFDRAPREMSLGQRRKCDLVAALLHSPSLILLDEPSLGLDYHSKVMFRELLQEYVDRYNVTVIISSHDLHELEQLCTRFIIIDKGALKFDGTLGELEMKSMLSNVLRLKAENVDQSFEEVERRLRDLDASVKRDGEHLEIQYSGSTPKILATIQDIVEVKELSMENKSLEKILMGVQ